MTGKEKWRKFLAGDDVGPMVCPLCDKWGVGDIDYRWLSEEPEPFADEEDRKPLLGQIMMAAKFKWDPLFYAAIHFNPEDQNLEPVIEKRSAGSRTQTITTIHTPLGDLTRIDEDNGVTIRCTKDYLVDEADYEKMLWLTTQDFQVEAALAEGRKLRAAAGDLGMMGTWVSPSVNMTDIQSLYYHAMDYPKAFSLLRDARRKQLRRQLGLYREAGFDFLFYCVPGTDMTSPGFFREWMAEEVKENIEWWKSLGGFTLWHACGHVKAFLDQGIFNEMGPEILETLSEPPVGNIPSLAWAREKLEDHIVSKGNIPLDILLEGSPADVRGAVRKVKESTKRYRHIIGLSDNILNGTPEINLKAFVDEGYTI